MSSPSLFGEQPCISISRYLARFANALSFKDLPSEVADRDKYLILVALNASLVKGLMTNGVGQDDMLFMLHLSAAIIPAVLAVAKKEDSSGAEIIAAKVAGYDILGKVPLGGPNIVPRFRGVSVFGPFVGAAPAGKLLKLNEGEPTTTPGYTANSASTFAECWFAGTMGVKFHTNMVSRNGIIAAKKLAEEGAKDAEASLEDKSGFYQAFARITAIAAAATPDLGRRFLIMGTAAKPYLVCGLQQVSGGLVLTLGKRHDIKGKGVVRILETMPEVEYSIPTSIMPTGLAPTDFGEIVQLLRCEVATCMK